MKRLALVVLVLAGCVGCDQATKRVAVATLAGQPTKCLLGDTLRLGLAHNEGAFLSMGANLPHDQRFWLLTVSVGVLLAGLLAFTLKSKRLSLLQVAGLAMVLGGGASNWLDRARDGGAVVDFLNLGIGSLRTGIFNVADVAILAGVALMVWPARSVRAADQRAA
jgi:signal peptidase II